MCDSPNSGARSTSQPASASAELLAGGRQTLCARLATSRLRRPTRVANRIRARVGLWALSTVVLAAGGKPPPGLPAGSEADVLTARVVGWSCSWDGERGEYQRCARGSCDARDRVRRPADLERVRPSVAGAGAGRAVHVRAPGAADPLACVVLPDRQPVPRGVRRFVAARGIPVLRLAAPDRSRWDDRKIDHVQPYLEQAEREGRFGVLALVAAEEIQWVWSARNRARKPGATWLEFFKERRRVGAYYFFIRDPEFGLGFIKICTCAPYSGRVWLNGLEWVKRQAIRIGLPFTPLDNGFASCPDPERLQAICDSFAAETCRRSLTAGSDRSRPRSAARIVPLATGGSSRCAKSRYLARWCWTTPAALAASSRRSSPPIGIGRPEEVSMVFARQTDQAAAPSAPNLHHRHRCTDRLSLQALARQAIPQGRPRATRRDGHQQPLRPRRRRRLHNLPELDRQSPGRSTSGCL